MRLLAAIAVVALWTLPAGAQEPVEKTFTSPFGLRLRVPAAWARRSSVAGVEFRAPGVPAESPPSLRIGIFPRRTDGGPAREAESLERTLGALQGSGFPFEVEGRETLEAGGRPAPALRWTDRLVDRVVLAVLVPLDGEFDVVLSFAASPAEAERFEPIQRRIVASFELVPARRAGSGKRLVRHPLGLSMEVPADWAESPATAGRAFEPPGYRGASWPLVVAVTAPAPAGHRTNLEVEAAVRADLADRGIELESVQDVVLGERAFRRFVWRDAGSRDRTVQLAAVIDGALYALTSTIPDESPAGLESSVRGVLDSVRFD